MSVRVASLFTIFFFIPSSSSSSSSVLVVVLVVFLFFFFSAFLFMSQEEAFSMAATNPRLMHRERRLHRVSSTYNLADGRVSVNMHFLSAPVVDERSRPGLVNLTFSMADKARLVGVPPPPPTAVEP